MESAACVCFCPVCMPVLPCHFPVPPSFLCTQASAAAFAKGLLDLEGNSLTPILVRGRGEGETG